MINQQFKVSVNIMSAPCTFISCSQRAGNAVAQAQKLIRNVAEIQRKLNFQLQQMFYMKIRTHNGNWDRNGENYVNALKNLKKFETPDSSVNRDTQRSGVILAPLLE